MTKIERHLTIKELLATRTISSQEDLKRELGLRGQDVTQATLSRDMKELGVSRISRGGVMAYAMPSEPGNAALRPIIGAEVVGIDSNELLIVVRTIPGAAHTVGEFIDVQKNADIIGTVAGDNTLLVIPASAAKTDSVLAFLKDQLFRAN